MVVSGGGRHLLKTGKRMTLSSSKFSTVQSNNKFGRDPAKTTYIKRLVPLLACRGLHFSKETTRSVVTKLSPQEVSASLSVQFLKC